MQLATDTTSQPSARPTFAAPSKEHPHRLYGRAALKPADMADAKRRRPASDLTAYAAARGLDALGSQNAAGYFAAMPLDPELQFNVIRGAFTPSRHGVLFHHLLAWPVDVQGKVTGPGLYAKVYNPPLPKRWWMGLSWLLPFSEWLPNGERDNEHKHAIGTPTTTVATPLPEAAGLQRARLDRRSDGGPLARVRAQIEDSLGERAFCRVELDFATLTVTVDGFIDDEAELDALRAAVCHAADKLAAELRAGTAPRPFDESLPEASWPAPEKIHVQAEGAPPEPWRSIVRALAAQHQLTIEDTPAFHRAHPSLPVPGASFAVLRGAIPGAPHARVVLTAERSLFRDNQGRSAVLLPAAPGIADTPPGGLRQPDSGLTVAVKDGVFAVWKLRSSDRKDDLCGLDELIATAVAHGERLGFVSTR